MNKTSSIVFPLFLLLGLSGGFRLINTRFTSTIQIAYAENTYYIKSQLNGFVLGTDNRY